MAMYDKPKHDFYHWKTRMENVNSRYEKQLFLFHPVARFQRGDTGRRRQGHRGILRRLERLVGHRVIGQVLERIPPQGFPPPAQDQKLVPRVEA